MPRIDVPTPPLTAEDYERIPEPDVLRLELWEGNLIVMRRAQMGWHSMAKTRLSALWPYPVSGVGVVLGPRDVVIPDVVAFRVPVKDVMMSQFPAGDVACVVEVVSPETTERDTRLKPLKYAAAGIPEFWLVTEHTADPFDVLVEIFKLTPEGSYGLAERALLSELEER